MKCRECGTAKGRYEDPRDPPLDEGECLCSGCHTNACEERIDELQQEINQLESELNKKRVKR